MGSEFDEQNGMKSPKEEDEEDNDDFAEPQQRNEQDTGAKGEFVTVPVTGN